ncbi:uncharacterized protein METZ01_LOCUS210078 [marine metagenome]|uniref:Thioredoxin-like fold domain-containing protein n=1 Tax=marine metagenome TaxID=408172 RepID=A0A382F4F5_9ZZZZ
MVPGDRRLAEHLAVLPVPVRLVFFTQTFGCDSCLPARQVIDEIAGLSKQITVEEYNLVLDKEKVDEFGVDGAPATAIVGARDLGLRYYGVPQGHELTSFVDAVVLASAGDTGLTPESLAVVATVHRPIDIKVFVTATCTFCPEMVRLAYRLAAASSHITTSVIEATEFPALVQKYRVSGVPKTIINDRIDLLGHRSEEVFVREALQQSLEGPSA